jgi:hypothetical protein
VSEIQIKVGGATIKPDWSTPAPAPAPVSEEKQPAKKKAADDDVSQINAKLHPEYDADLKERIKRIPKRDRSGIYREALRQYFRNHS